MLSLRSLLPLLLELVIVSLFWKELYSGYPFQDNNSTLWLGKNYVQGVIGLHRHTKGFPRDVVLII